METFVRFHLSVSNIELHSLYWFVQLYLYISSILIQIQVIHKSFLIVILSIVYCEFISITATLLIDRKAYNLLFNERIKPAII